MSEDADEIFKSGASTMLEEHLDLDQVAYRLEQEIHQHKFVT